MSRQLDCYEEYWREAAMCALEEAGVDIKVISSEQFDEVGRALRTSEECRSLAFHTPEHPAVGERDRLQRRLKWQQELEHCEPCKGTGRIRYNAGPWSIDTGCDRCRGAGKRHPRNELEPRP